MKCSQKECYVDLGIGCSMGEPSLENCEHLPNEYKRRLVCRDKFLDIYRNSIHYKALQEANENNSEVFFLSYCHDSDDFIDPNASDAYGVFKACQGTEIPLGGNSHFITPEPVELLKSGFIGTDTKALNEFANSLMKEWRDQALNSSSDEHYMQMTLEQLQQEHAELLLFNEDLDRRCKVSKAEAKKYQSKCWQITTLLMNPIDKDMTLKAIETVIERVGEA